MILYTEQDFENTRQTLKKRALILTAIIAVTVLLAAFFMTVVRNHIAVLVIPPLGGCAAYLYTAIKLMPWFKYWVYQNDMRTGLSRETDGWFVSCSSTARISDGVEFREFILRIGDKEEDERLFFWDCDKQFPEITAGQKIHLRSFGNYITELHFAE